MNNTFKEGDIVVAIFPQSTGCGSVTYINKGSILEVAQDNRPWESMVKVYRNLEEKHIIDFRKIHVTSLRKADSSEEYAFRNGIYFVEQLTPKS